MRAIALALAVCACTDPPVDEQPSGLAPCEDYFAIYATPPHPDEPFIAPILGRVWIEGTDWRAAEGASNPQPDGTTLVWRALEYHQADGSFEPGSVGRRGDETLCEWAAAIRYEP